MIQAGRFQTYDYSKPCFPFPLSALHWITPYPFKSTKSHTCQESTYLPESLLPTSKLFNIHSSLPYDTKRLAVPLALFCGADDNLCDLDYILQECPKPVACEQIPVRYIYINMHFLFFQISHQI